MKIRFTNSLSYLLFASLVFVGSLPTTAQETAQTATGPRVGASLSPFEVVKCGGGDDGIEVGESLCYRSRNGIRPQVIVFVHDGNELEKVTELAKKLDTWVGESDNQRAFINVLGDSADEIKKSATKFADTLSLEKLPIVVPIAVKNGPEDYSISPDKKVTALIVKRGRIKAVVDSDGSKDAQTLAKEVIDKVQTELK